MSAEKRTGLDYEATLALPEDCPPEIVAMIGCALAAVAPVASPAPLVETYGRGEAQSRALAQAALLMLARFVASVPEPDREAMLEAFPAFLRRFVVRNVADDVRRKLHALAGRQGGDSVH